MEISKVITLLPPREGYCYNVFVKSLRSLSDGRFLAINSPYIDVYDPKTGIADIKFIGYKAIQNPNTNQLILPGPAGYVSINDLKEGEELSRFLPHEDGIYSIIHIKGNIFASCSDDKSICIWDIENFKILQKCTGHTDNVTNIILLPDDRIASSSWDNTIRIWNIKSGACHVVFNQFKDEPLKGGIKMKVICINSCAYFILSCKDSKLKILNPKTEKCTFEYEEKNLTFAIPWTQHRFITNGDNGNINIFSIFDRKKETIKLHEQWISKAKLIDGNTLLTCSSDTTLKIYDLLNRTILQTLQGHKKEVICFARLKDGEIVSGSLDGTIIIWKNAT